MTRRLASLCIFALVAAVVAVAQTGAETQCASCHDQTEKIKKSVHAEVGCATCHDGHEKYPHPEGSAKPECATCHDSQAAADARGVHGMERKGGNAGAPECGSCHGSAHEALKPASMEFRKASADTCGMCHSDVATQFKSSVHGKAVQAGIPQAPICTDCHGEHSIERPKNAASPVHASHIRDTCGRCHGDVRLSNRFGLPPDRVTSFDASFHGLAARSGSQTVANCASCHGVHNILPSSDAASTVHASKLPQTCGQCHAGAGTRFALGPIHWSEQNKEPEGVRWARVVYVVLIPLTIGLMFIHNLGDWIRKVYTLRFKRRAGDQIVRIGPTGEQRMFRFERIQHALLVLSFFVLVWTGFSLKYPDQWWARPLLSWEARNSLRGLVHRIAGAAFIAVSVVHLVSLFVSKRLRKHWHEMLPNRNDIPEAMAWFAHYLGLRKRPPMRSAHSYVEKAEYWAVVWGAIVMAGTGVVLWANNLALQWLPKSVLDFFTAVHFYEAVLATLAIVVWHFYFVLFDPEVYPMDPAWLTGFSVRRRQSHEPHPPEKPAAPAPAEAHPQPVSVQGNSNE